MPEELKRVLVDRPFGMVSTPPAERSKLLSWMARSAVNNKDIARGKSPTKTQDFQKASADGFDSNLTFEVSI